GDVLYLALEDGEPRLQRRIAKLLPASEPWPAAFQYAVDWPQADEGITKIEKWCESARAPRLVVIDVLEKFRRPAADKNAYGRDYSDLAPVQKLATRRQVAILLVHHTRKGASDAVVERISGTLALPGAADAWLVLQRTSTGATLVGSGRDAAEVDLAVEFNRDTCRWTVLGPASEVQRASTRAKVLRFLEEQGRSGATPGDVASELEITPQHAKAVLHRMARAGEVLRPGRGLYFHPAVTSVTLLPSGKNGAAAGLAGEGHKVTEVTVPEWQLPLVAVQDGSKS
ncbi:MAG TPA: AAA family ATPase, partial [Bradyrhizobium sp.]|nr:AAA family ATPase [Bradyrhizobium sp.]